MKLKAQAKALRDKAAGTADPSDDAQAEARAQALETEAGLFEAAPKLLGGAINLKNLPPRGK